MATLSSDGKYVTVVAGDTLYNIAKTHNTTVDNLVKLNNIKDANKISVGQKIYLTTQAEATVNNTYQATILQFGPLSTNTKTLLATWEWTKEDTGSYQVKWEYLPKDWPDTWLSAGPKSISVNKEDPDAAKQDTYSIPDSAISVRFSVKPLPKTESSGGGVIYSSGSGGSTSTAWTATWSTVKYYNVGNTPITPTNLSVEINESGLLLAILENLNVNATTVHFQVVKREGTGFVVVNGNGYVGTTIRFVDSDGNGTIEETERVNGYARYSLHVDDGGEYRVRVRSSIGGLYSDWSAYSSSVYTKPAPPEGITTIRASSKTSVYLEWAGVDGATSYEIQYATKRDFDISNQQVWNDSTDLTYRTLTGLATGSEYFFRVRAKNQGGESKWSDVASVILGSTPAAPTTWSSSTTVTTGSTLALYWVHNSEDGSREKSAEIEITSGGTTTIVEKVNATPEDEPVKTGMHEIDTSTYPEGAEIKWRVRTKGVTDTYGEWSIQRTVDIYANPTLTFTITDSSGLPIDILTSFPLKIYAMGGPSLQTPVSYHLAVSADTAYDTFDNIGNPKTVSANEEVYSKHYTTSGALREELSPANISLENNITYTVTCTVIMNSGLTAVQSSKFTVGWSYDNYWPNAEISINDKAYTATIRPYCTNVSGKLIDGVTLAVYRRDYDGSFIKILDGMPNDNITCVVDPHPALDYARYRIIATQTSTGSISYYDMPGVRVGSDAIIIQWDEPWSYLDTPDTVVSVEPVWTGSVVKLPYNIDVSEKSDHDVELIKYIGRTHPVSYYGTHRGESASWNTDIDKNDKNTLYALRRLARWAGNVYVREPSGVGYWSTITVSLSQSHNGLTIPVTLDITRVEGGI